MEFYWGHAAAASPYLNKSNNPQPSRATTSSSNLTTLSTADSSSGASSASTATPRPTKKSRIPGHRRATSTDTTKTNTPTPTPAPATGSTTFPQSHETPRKHLPLPLPLPQTAPEGALSLEQLHQHLRQAHSPGGTPAATSGGGVTTSFFPAASPERDIARGWPAAPPSATAPNREKQLPATPAPLDTSRGSFRARKGSNTAQNNNNKPATTTTTGTPPVPSSASPLTASSPGSFSGPSANRPPAVGATVPDKGQTQPQPQQHPHHAYGMLSEAGAFSKIAFGRNESASTIQSQSGAGTAMSARSLMSSETGGTGTGAAAAGSSSVTRPPRPFVVRNGRTFLSDPSLVYPLPVDLVELHRQSLRTLLLFQLFGGPVCSPEFENRPPVRVLELGCGSGFWSMMCHRYYSGQGHSGISFTGMDMAPLDSGMLNPSEASTPVSGPTPASSEAPTPAPTPNPSRSQKDMKWHFVQHDMRRIPWPLPDEHFDLVMVKDLSLAITNDIQPKLVDEYLRVLRPGGVLEIWESDHTLRMLRPHIPDGAALKQAQQQQQQQQRKNSRSNNTEAGDSSSDDDSEHDSDDASSSDDEYEAAAKLGAYIMSGNTPLSAPLNTFIVEYNGWISKALEARSLNAIPCTGLGPMLLQEAETLGKIGSRRLAIPLSEVKWEREGVGGVVTKDGKSYVESAKRPVVPGWKEVAGKGGEKRLTGAQAALRRTALLTFVQQMQAMEPALREVSGKSQDEWDAWMGKMMNDLMRENGTSWGECMEVGAWWATKKRKR